MNKKIFTGLVIIVIGILSLLGNMGVISYAFDLGRVWPVVALALLLGSIFDNKKIGSGSIILLCILLYFVLNNYDFIKLGMMEVIFPILLILIGLAIMLPKEHAEEFKNDSSKSDINLNAIFSGTNSKSKSKSLRKISITSVFGDAGIDLDDASAKDGKCMCEIVTVFGGVTINLPEDWSINMDGLTCILGGVEDKRREIKDAKNVLYLSGVVIFGGIEIK